MRNWPNVQPGSDRISQPSPPGSRWQPGLPKPAQHAAAFVVHRPLNGRAGRAGSHGRVAHHQRALPSGNRSVVAARRGPSDPGAANSSRAQASARVPVGGHHALHTTARQHGRQHPVPTPHQRRAPCWAAAPARPDPHIPTHRRETRSAGECGCRRCAQGGDFRPSCAIHGRPPAQQLTQRSHHAIPAGGPQARCRPGASRARGAAQSCNRLPARSAPTTAPARCACACRCR